MALEPARPGQAGAPRRRGRHERIVEPAHEGVAHRLTERVGSQRPRTMGQDRLAQVERHVGVVGPVAQDHLAGADARVAHELQWGTEAVAAGVGQEGSAGSVGEGGYHWVGGHEGAFPVGGGRGDGRRGIAHP